MPDLSDILERFNRSERSVLLRDALGSPAQAPHLAAGFLDRVASALGIEGMPSPDAIWWAPDFHLDWLAGALLLFTGEFREEGNDASKLPPAAENHEGAFLTAKGSQQAVSLVKANQEDVDLVLCYGETLILIDARAYGGFGHKQVDRKIARIGLLAEFYDGIRGGAPAISLHFLMTSPNRLEKLETKWSSWGGKGGRLAWMKLDLPDEHDVLRVARWDPETDEPKRVGTAWKLIEMPPAAEVKGKPPMTDKPAADEPLFAEGFPE